MIELTRGAYEELLELMHRCGGKLHIGKYEGSTMRLGSILLVRADGYYWLTMVS